MNILDINVDVQSVCINTKNDGALPTNWSLTREGDDTELITWLSNSSTFVNNNYYQTLSIDTSSVELNNNATYILRGVRESDDTLIYTGKVLAVDYTETGYMTLESTTDYITYN